MLPNLGNRLISKRYDDKGVQAIGKSKAIQTAIYIKMLHSALTFSPYVYKILVANFAKIYRMLDSIESAIEDIKAGKIVIAVDDEDRENEGDFIVAARHASPDVINFMSKYGRGLICVPLLEERCEELGLDLMVNNNTALHETAFTVSVDLLGHGCTTGISAHDRSKTVQALIDPATRPEDLGKPGHIFPLIAKKRWGASSCRAHRGSYRSSTSCRT